MPKKSYYYYDMTVAADADDGSYQLTPLLDGPVPHGTLKVICHSHENSVQ